MLRHFFVASDFYALFLYHKGMKRVVLISGYDDAHIKTLLESAGFFIVDSDPDLVVSYGGDGTLMRAEDQWPGIPKLILKGSKICKLCNAFSNEEVVRRVAAGDYTFKEVYKIEAVMAGESFIGLNDIVVHNENSRHGIRYRLSVNGRAGGDHEIIGDGIVVATPFGSTGYYRSITHSFFETGIGVAFNNSTERFDHMVLRDDAVIGVTIVRGPAAVYADNSGNGALLHEGDSITIRQSDAVARIITVI